MRIGICTDVSHIKMAYELGFDYVEGSASWLAGLSEKEFLEYKNRLLEYPIQYECFNGLLPGDLAITGAQVNENEVKEYLERVFGRIHAIGGKIAVFGSGRTRRVLEGMDFDASYRQVVQFTKMAGKVAEENQVTIAIEPLNRLETNLICSVAEGAMLRADVNMDSVQLLADSYHMFMEEEPMDNLLRAGHLAHVHVALKEDRSFPYREDGQLEKFFDTLKRIGYDGRVSIEGRTKQMEQDAAHSIRTLRKYVERY